MKIFSSKIHLNPGLPLGGNDPDRFNERGSDQLEINGVTFTGWNENQYRLCSIDALYPGRLIEEFASNSINYIFAASHTHYAPMLDDAKPKIGHFSEVALKSYIRSISEATSLDVSPNVCRMYRAEVDVPIYRRFDYPINWVNSLLTRYAGLYPNQELAIDKNIYIFEFAVEDKASFVIVYHACHPVSRGMSNEISSDYVGALRNSIRERFKVDVVIFLLGCSGDIRPNLAQKRISWLPKCKLNWRFNSNPSASQQGELDLKYVEAVDAAKQYDHFSLTKSSMKVIENEMVLKGGRSFQATEIEIGGKLRFTFLPFEVSHLFWLELRERDGNHFMVSCSGNTQGYLSHPTQFASGGYEVDGSLPYMELKERIEISRGRLF